MYFQFKRQTVFLKWFALALLLRGTLILSFSETTELPFSTETLASGPYSTMQARYDKGLLFINFEVLDVEIRFGRDETERLASLVRGRTRSQTLEDEVAEVGLQATDALLKITFLRNLGLNRFIAEARMAIWRVHETGLITRDIYQKVVEGLPVWYSFLNDRDIQNGDHIYYRILGDQLQTVYCDPAGKILFEQTVAGPHHRLVVLGSYLVPRSEFRPQLVESLFIEQFE